MSHARVRAGRILELLVCYRRGGGRGVPVGGSQGRGGGRARGRGGGRGRGRQMNDDDRKDGSESSVRNNGDVDSRVMDNDGGAMDPPVQPNESKLVKQYKNIAYEIIILEAGKAGGGNTKDINKKIGMKCQAKYADAKKEVGKPHAVMMDIFGDLEIMGMVGSTMIRPKDVGRGGSRYDVKKVELCDADQIMEAITGSRKDFFASRVKKCGLNVIFLNLAVRKNKLHQMKQLLATIC